MNAIVIVIIVLIYYLYRKNNLKGQKPNYTKSKLPGTPKKPDSRYSPVPDLPLNGKWLNHEESLTIEHYDANKIGVYVDGSADGPLLGELSGNTGKVRSVKTSGLSYTFSWDGYHTIVVHETGKAFVRVDSKIPGKVDYKVSGSWIANDVELKIMKIDETTIGFLGIEDAAGIGNRLYSGGMEFEMKFAENKLVLQNGKTEILFTKMA